MLKKLDAILFDLDGTLLDTAPDIAYAINKLLYQYKKSALPYEVIRAIAGHGGKGLIQLGFNIQDDDPSYMKLWESFINFYLQHIADQTCLFDGMDQVLTYLFQQKIPWGIVTNKPSYLTEPLLKKIGLFTRTNCIVCGDTLTKRKPDPEPLLYACQLMNTSPENCIYIGDAERDIEAGRRAGMKTLIAAYGYLAENDTISTWGADGILENALDILKVL